MNKFHLWPEEPTVTEGSTTVKVTIENPDKTRQSLWYRFPEQYYSRFSSSCDSFLAALLFKFMNQPADVMVHGQVSPSLLRNLMEYQAIWHCWRPQRYQPVEIEAEVEQEGEKCHQTEGAIATFSGGVDSCFTVLRHRQPLCHRRLQQNVQAGLMMHGFDIPLSSPQVFEIAATRSRRMLASLDVELIPIATNIQQFRQEWADSFIAAAVSCLMLFQKAYSTGLIPSSEPYQALPFPWGSHPMTDNLLSSQSFSIINDGAAFSRLEKMAELTKWPEAMEYLQVCWKTPEGGGNCGRCEKCLRTILCFRLLEEGLPSCFATDVSDRQILSLATEPLSVAQCKELGLIASAAKTKGLSDSWVRALEIAVIANPVLNPLKQTLRQSLPKSIKSKLKQIIPI